MSLRALGVLVVLALFLVLPGAADAKRVALVIGNAAYRSAPALRNPVNDATRLAEELQSLGFEVLTGIDLDVAGMREVVRAFADAAEGAELALFFYAGHGLQVDGRNYLLPVDAAVGSEADLDFAAMDLDLVLRQMNRGAAAKIVLLDACRNNPFEGRLARSMGQTRSADALGRGLARLDAPGGSLIAFATDPGAVAADGEGEHSPFTQALLNHLDTPGLEINVMMTRVRAEVFEATRHTQRPWTSSSLIGELYLAPAEPDPAGATASAVGEPGQSSRSAVEIAFWTAAEGSGELSDYEAYLREYPDGAFVALASNRIARLRSSSATGSAAGPGEAEGGGHLAALDPASPATARRPEAAPTPEEVEQALGLDRAKRREVQERLTILGYDTRGIDGILGQGSRAAIASWQKKNGLPATGFLDREQISRLDSETDAALPAFRERKRLEAAAAAARAEQRRHEAAGKAATGAASRDDPGGQQGDASETAPFDQPDWGPVLAEPAGDAAAQRFRAISECAVNRARGMAYHMFPMRARRLALRRCIVNGGTPVCCQTSIEPVS